jgi:hypothetical protein
VDGGVNAALGKRGIEAKRDLVEGSVASPNEAVTEEARKECHGRANA